MAIAWPIETTKHATECGYRLQICRTFSHETKSSLTPPSQLHNRQRWSRTAIATIDTPMNLQGGKRAVTKRINVLSSTSSPRNNWILTPTLVLLHALYYSSGLCVLMVDVIHCAIDGEWNPKSRQCWEQGTIDKVDCEQDWIASSPSSPHTQMMTCLWLSMGRIPVLQQIYRLSSIPF
ncbi:hypothetical protein B0O80DRAFT_269547 [Mortierella sp. GBAus27b]|nr:hypothetical protein B0O80DRAFT_269547 [Mortierella sp. GBAus27b]